MVSVEEFDRIQKTSKVLKTIFARDRFKYSTGAEDYIVRAVEEAARHFIEVCPEDRHMYYSEFLTYNFCPYCGQRVAG